jgi:hypothetical protein
VEKGESNHVSQVFPMCLRACSVRVTGFAGVGGKPD